MYLSWLKSKKKEILLTLFTTIISFILIIGLIEWVHYKKHIASNHHKFDPVIGWVPVAGKLIKKGNTVYKYNSLGFRSEEVDPKKNHILVLGDSVAWGHGLGNEDTISHLLNKRLPNHQVLNLAVNGYGIDQYYLFLKRNIELLNPKLVIVVIYAGNDIQNTGSNISYGKSKPLFKLIDGTLNLVHKPGNRFSCINIFSGSWLLNRPYISSLKEKTCEINSLKLNNLKKVISVLLRNIKELAERHNAKTLFTLSPSLYDLKVGLCEAQKMTQYCQHFMKLHLHQHKKIYLPTYNYNAEYYPIDTDLIRDDHVMIIKRLHRLRWGPLAIFQSIFESENIKYLNYYKELLFSGRSIYDIIRLYRDTHHYSELGNQVLSDVIFKVIEKNKILN